MNHEIESRVTSFLGLCLRAGRLTTGQEACVELIRRGGAALALVDGGASANTLKRLSDACRSHDTPLYALSPGALGHSDEERAKNLVQVMDGYFMQGAHHLNVNVFGTEKLIDAMEHPEKEEYANFTIRVSGYAVKFIDLTREQQMDVISRTCHAAL